MEQIIYGLIGICILLMIVSIITDSISRKRKYLLFFMAFSAMMLLIADRAAHILNGAPGMLNGYLVRISRFFAYALSLVIILIFAQYIKDLLRKEGGLEEVPKSLLVVDCISLTGISILTLSQFTGLYYIYDKSNAYRRSLGYPIAYIIPAIALVATMYAIVKHRKNLRKRLFMPLLLFTAAPLIASTANFFIHKFTLTTASIVGMTVLLYCFSILDANEIMRTAHRKEIENQKTMLAQTAAALAEAIDAKDAYTSGHSQRVAEYSAKIAERYGKSKEECEEIYLIALLHDVGKIGVPNSIINKNGKLTDEEYEVIKTHPSRGNEILKKISIAPNLSIGAHYHHERFDGKGYPEGLKGEEIPEIARIIAVADAYDAMTSKRSYRDGLPVAKVKYELIRGMGTQFDTRFANIMIEIIDEPRGNTQQLLEKFDRELVEAIAEKAAELNAIEH